MPHITIEYSANVAEHHDVQALVAEVHRAALDHGLASIDALRTRAARRDQYLVADGEVDHAFVAIAVRIGPGRSDAGKTSFIAAILDSAEAQLDSEGGPLAVAWSVELNEIDPTFRINRNHVRTRINARGDSP